MGDRAGTLESLLRQLRALAVVVFGGGALLAGTLGVAALGYQQVTKRPLSQMPVSTSWLPPRAPTPADLQLTNIQTVRSNGLVTVSGDVSNPGPRAAAPVTIEIVVKEPSGTAVGTTSTVIPVLLAGQSEHWQVTVPDQGWPRITADTRARWTWR